MQHIYIVTSADSEANLRLVEELRARLGERLQDVAEIHVVNYQRLRFLLGKKAEVIDTVSGTDLLTADLVYFKSFVRYEEQAVALAHLLDHANVAFIGDELRSNLSQTKVSQYARLWTAGLPLPDTMYTHAAVLEEAYDPVCERLGSPFIMKATGGRGGDANYLVKSQAEYGEVVARHPDQEFVMQRFIDNDADLRVITLGYKAELVIKRQRTSNDTHLNNTSQGAQATLLPLTALSAAHIALCETAAKTLHREIAGVDLLFEKNSGTPYILEVNASPQLGSGAYVEEKIKILGTYMRKLLKK